MINIKNITAKNFMSIGNVTQAVNFMDSDLTLVIGNNLDLGGGGSRNGTGKTTILNALSYALYGSALTNIRKDNLINKTNNKGMLVTAEFEINGTDYRIERGRKPNTFKFLVNEHEYAGAEAEDEVQGNERDTQAEIEKILSMSHDMFKHLVALNTYTEPFLSMRANDQRQIIEQLLGITLLSEKATILKEQIKETKDIIKEEEFKIKGIEDANKAIEKSISDLERRKDLWISKQKHDIEDMESAIEDLDKLDIDQEIKNHALLEEYTTTKSKRDQLSKDLTRVENLITSESSRLAKYEKELESLLNHECFACGQKMHDTDTKSLIDSKKESVAESTTIIEGEAVKMEKIEAELASLPVIDKPDPTFYDTLSDAYDHKNKVDQLRTFLSQKSEESDPYTEQVESLKTTGLQEINWNKINDMNSLREHQDFLLKLLTNKDSFVRKRIIEQNLAYLNSRLGYYLTKLGLPHEVNFQPDLTVEITELGRSLDFDNLSRGERNRLILGLSWAFRDVFENMNTPINLLAVDELIDSGMDSNGVEMALDVLKKMVRDRNKNVFLVSHRDELVGRVNHTLQVLKENGFTTFSTETDYTL